MLVQSDSKSKAHVDDMGLHYKSVGPTELFRVAHREVDHDFLHNLKFL